VSSTPNPTVFDRSDALSRLEHETFDVVVVGGGITGVGCALDAASRGLRTALVERDDFASGTSSKSSKLVHGGLRYLSQGDVRLVYEALAERQRLRHNAPHLVKLLPFLLPVFSGKDGVISKKLSRALGSAMWMYDLTGGARIGKLHKRISAEQAWNHMPTLHRDRLASSYLYYDAEADDARLTLTVARTAALDFGAVMLNRAAVRGIGDPGGAGTSDEGVALRTLSVEVTQSDGSTRTVEVRTAAVINAAGVWADQIRTLDEGADPDSIRPAKGIHITVAWDKVRNDIAAVIPVPGDSRSVFVVPWGRFTFIGTTDTDYDGPLEDPQCTAADVEYLLRAINGMVRPKLTEADVVGTWAGLRPLVKASANARTADLSRRHQVVHSASGVVSVTGGKLTTYREMAADAVDHLLTNVLTAPGIRSRVRRRTRTKKLRLRGAEGYDRIAALAEHPPSGLSGDAMSHLANRYGGETTAIIELVAADPTLAQPLVPGTDYLRAEAVYAVRHEMATTLDDVLSRRTRARLQLRDATAAAAEAVAELIGAELGWDTSRRAEEVAAFRASVDTERTSPGLPVTTAS
jgi:glycerol-3-phosphate dehydrogenase